MCGGGNSKPSPVIRRPYTHIAIRIRFAAPPISHLRWQAPQVPATNRTVVIATTRGPACPQSYPAGAPFPFTLGDEDCLFLDVYAPANASNQSLPVVVWIHGGGYGFGDGSQDLSTFINSNGNGFIGVSIQYRVGTFLIAGNNRCLFMIAWCLWLFVFGRCQDSRGAECWPTRPGVCSAVGPGSDCEIRRRSTSSHYYRRV
jgi:hypothetical protein